MDQKVPERTHTVQSVLQAC